MGSKPSVMSGCLTLTQVICRRKSDTLLTFMRISETSYVAINLMIPNWELTSNGTMTYVDNLSNDVPVTFSTAHIVPSFVPAFFD